MHYFHNLSSASGSYTPKPLLGLHLWTVLGTFVPILLICPPLEKNHVVPMTLIWADVPSRSYSLINCQEECPSEKKTNILIGMNKHWQYWMQYISYEFFLNFSNTRKRIYLTVRIETCSVTYSLVANICICITNYSSTTAVKPHAAAVHNTQLSVIFMKAMTLSLC